jgi:hypothetical protein
MPTELLEGLNTSEGDFRGSADTPAVPLSATTPKLPASSE